MRRPLVLGGFCYLLTQAAAVFFGIRVSFLLFFVCLAGFICTLCFRRFRSMPVFPVAFLAAAVAFGAFCLYTRFTVEPVRALDGQDVEMEGIVCELPVSQFGRWYYVVQVDSISLAGAPQNFKIRLSSQNALDVQPYSHIHATIHLFQPSGGEGYSSAGYYISKGITMFAWMYAYNGVEISPPTQKPPYYYALKLRQSLLDSVDSLFPAKEAAFIKAVLLGDKTSLSEDVISDFRTAGISHLMAVSGLHMAAVAQLLLLFLMFLHVPKKPAAIAAAFGVFGFMAVTCFVPSVTRSGFMCLLCLAAPIVSRRADPLNSLCAAALLICLGNPWAAADVGFLLSFFATLGLILFSGPAAAWLNTRLDRVKALSPLVRGFNGIAATSIAAILFTLPVILLNFGFVSLVAPLSNLLELVPATLLIFFAAPAALLNLLLPQSCIALPFAVCAGWIAKYMQACASWLAALPNAGVSASQGFLFLWLGGSILLFASAYFLGKGVRLFRRTVLLCVIVLLFGILSRQIADTGVTRVAVLDTGTGLSVAVTRSGHAAVIGCGGYNSGEILSYLSSQNVGSCDDLQILTQDQDESAAMLQVARRFMPGLLLVQQDSRIDGYVSKAQEFSARTVYYQDRSQTSLWGDATIDTCSCGKEQAACITAQGVSILICPDGADFSQIPQEWKNCDFCVLDGAMPKNAGVSPLCSIYALDAQVLPSVLQKANGQTCVWTAGCGNIIIDLKGDRKLSVIREET